MSSIFEGIMGIVLDGDMPSEDRNAQVEELVKKIDGELTDEEVQEILGNRPDFDDGTLAPKNWSDYIGQEKAKLKLETIVQACLKTGNKLRNVMFVGRSGDGKTTLAEILANRMGMGERYFCIDLNPATSIPAVLNKILLVQNHVDIIILDEIQSVSKKDQEFFLNAIERGRITDSKGNVQFLTTMPTWICTTTDEHKIIPALRSRFGIRIELEEYSRDEMAEMVESMCYQLGVEPTIEGCYAFADASGGRPRQARELVYTAADLESMEDHNAIIQLNDMYSDGMSKQHLNYLSALAELGGQAGLNAITSQSGYHKDVLFETEQYLIKLGYIDKKQNGRHLTAKGKIRLKEVIEKGI